MKKHSNKELVMTKEHNENFENSIKCQIQDNDYINSDAKLRDPCLIIGKYRDSAHRGYNINVKLNHKIPIVFHDTKNYDSHLIMQEIGKFSFKINVILNGLEKYMNFSITNKLGFIDTFQFPSFHQMAQLKTQAKVISSI